ncbi:MAG TPA: xanthine dehydrogenase family protein molybdopterin-binding subunit [Xanthobacteraceae bacterium]|nr:xanthine dehydrogenase family protein molybdopterin-binding subunit [Xanthobacteraceae bacterium]
MADENTRQEKFPFGIASVSIGEIERRVPPGEAPPLAPNDRLALIGKSVPRYDGRAKVTGAAHFTVDVKLPGMLHGRLLRSPHPHARIVSIDTAAAERQPGVRAVHVITEIVGRAVEAAGETDPPQPNGVRLPRALYVGAPIAAVAAVTPEAAAAALALIKVEYEVLPFVVDLEEARDPAAPAVFRSAVAGSGYAGGAEAGAQLPQQGNIRGPSRVGTRGDVAKGFAEAEIVVEGEYRTQVQTHCCMETHAAVADWRADGLTVYLSTQFTAGVRAELAAAFGLPRNRVRVLVDAMGGGFGSKSGAGTYARVAVALSRAAGAPVRVVHDRHEEQLDSGNRPATFQRLKIGARRDGQLSAIALYTYGTAGTATGAGVGNFAQAIYECPNFDSEQYDVFINAGPASAMRAPGNTPGAFALEQAVDELAEKLSLDPLALRERIDASPVRREQRRLGAARIGWSRRHAPGADSGTIKRGIGMAQSLWGANVQTNASCELLLMRDGAVELRSSVQDIGTGIRTALAQVVAEELGLTPQAITLRIGDTDFPAGPPSHGSRTTASITPPARNAAYEIKQRLCALVAPRLGVAASALELRDGRVLVRAEPARGLSFREAAALLRTDAISAFASRSDDYGGFRRTMGDAALAQNDLGGVQFAQVAVDTETGIIRVERVVAVQDCGRPINPAQVESQVQGGVLMGVSYALYEERILDRPTGHVLNADLEHYKIAGPRETPEIEVVVLENYQGESATDAYGIAEPSNIATAPAIANAVYNAIGVRLRQLPMTPAAVLAALGRTPSGG